MYCDVSSLITIMAEDRVIVTEVEVDIAMMVVGGEEEAEDEDSLVSPLPQIRVAKILLISQHMYTRSMISMKRGVCE